MYEKLPGISAAPFNVFQRMDEASELWQSAIGRGYGDILNATEFVFLKKMVQRRHKLGHSQGMIDSRYVRNTGDSNYQPGQRLVVNQADVRELAKVATKLVAGLMQHRLETQ